LAANQVSVVERPGPSQMAAGKDGRDGGRGFGLHAGAAIEQNRPSETAMRKDDRGLREAGTL